MSGPESRVTNRKGQLAPVSPQKVHRRVKSTLAQSLGPERKRERERERERDTERERERERQAIPQRRIG